MKLLPSELLPDQPTYNLKHHLAHVQELWRQYPYNNLVACGAKAKEIVKSYEDPFRSAVSDFIIELFYDNDVFIVEEPTTEYAPYLTRMQKRLTMNMEPVFTAAWAFINDLDELLPKGNGQFSLPYVDCYDAAATIGFCYKLYDRRDWKINEYYFPKLRQQLHDNLITASGYNLDTYKNQDLDTPEESKLPPERKLVAYLKDTPFLPLFASLTIPFQIPLDTYKEHGFLFAKSGHGKSQTMRALFADLIQRDCALFVLDGNGALIENLDRIESIRDRLVILDPDDAPALNFFTMTGSSREKQMELFFYLFKAIDQGLTERQATMISYLVDLMQVIPGATLDTLRDVCEVGIQHYSGFLQHLDPITHDFFTRQFGKKDPYVGQTRQQIAQRLYTIGRNRSFSAMFNAPENKFDAFKLMQEKKIVIVDTSREKLGDQGSAIFGRYILAQCLAAAWQRPKDQRHLALIMLDEAKTYLDDQSKKILSDARAFGVGLLLASQFPDQLDDGVRKEVINNTSIKLAGPAAFSVVAQMNRDLRCDPDFILDMKKKDPKNSPAPPYYAEWACYVDNLTPRAIKLTVPFGAIERLATMDNQTHKALREYNRRRFGSSPATIIRTQSNAVPPVAPQPPVTPRDTPDQSPMEFDTDH